MKMREVVGKTLINLVNEGKDIVIVDPEMISSTGMTSFEDMFPERTFTVGIAEQNAVGIAVGLAAYGKIAFVSSFSCFLSTRSLDQIRVGCAYSNLNVKLVGGHGGIATGPDGATHQALEDIAIIRSIPNMKLFVPADGIETEQIIRMCVETEGPTYVRLTRPDVNNILNLDYQFKMGKSVVVREGDDATVIACGISVTEALKAARELSSKGIEIRIINMSSIKPLDVEAILKAVSETGALVTAEDHGIFGGLAGAVSEVLAEYGVAVPFEKVAVKDQFGKSGPTDILMNMFGISSEHIAQAVERAITNKVLFE